VKEAVVNALLDILRRERNAALEGNFDELFTIIKLKENQFHKLKFTDDFNGELREVRVELARNQSIISAVIAGVKSARDHLADVNSTSKNVNVYTRSGSLETFDGRDAKNSKKY
jgi:hypothetical protein